MLLTVDRQDLKGEHENIPCSSTKFEHFNEKAQAAISAVGCAMFVEPQTYNAIYPPDEKK